MSLKRVTDSIPGLKDEDKAKMSRVQTVLNSHGSSRDADPDEAAKTKGWDVLWQEDVTPWARSRVEPPFEYLMDRLAIQTRGRSALIPGCGRGDDVVHLTHLGFEATGIDSSETAVQRAKEWIDSQALDPSQQPKVVVADFFSLEPPEGGYQFVYDYTFFCAIPPTLHERWATSMKRLVAPGGLLVTMVFPIHGDRTDGPPYSVSVPLYESLLGAGWTKLLDEEPHTLKEQQKGFARVVVWKADS